MQKSLNFSFMVNVIVLFILIIENKRYLKLLLNFYYSKSLNIIYILIMLCNFVAAIIYEKNDEYLCMH